MAAGPHANRLLPVVGLVACLAAAAVLLKSCGPEKPPATSEALPKAPTADADSPAETLRSLTAQVADMKTTNQALIKENEALRYQNKQTEETVTARVLDKVHREGERQEHQALTQLRRRFDDLALRLSAAAPKPPAGEVPVGPGPADAQALVWIEPLDAEPSSYPGQSFFHKATNTAGFTGASDAAQGGAKPLKEKRPSVKPRYTINRNATLIGSTAMTALIGRIPVKGRVQDPLPFKVIVGAENLAANGLTIPGVEGMIASGLAVGDWNLSCATGRITSMTFVFRDGTIRTVSADDQELRGTTTLNTTYPGGGLSDTHRESLASNTLGWISDERGVPCISGQLITNAASFLTQRLLVGAVEAAGDAVAKAETTRTVTPLGGSLSTVTGDIGKFVLGETVAGGSRELAEWLKERQLGSFDVVYVDPGKPVALHLDKEIRIDYDPEGRKVSYAHPTDPNRRPHLD